MCTELCFALSLVFTCAHQQGLASSKDQQLALHKDDMKWPRHRMMPVSQFVPKKDFDTIPATLNELNPPLQTLPYQPAPKDRDAILDRDYRHKMPMRKGKRSRLAKGKVAHVINWNKETAKPKGWKPLEETPMYQNGHIHEYRRIDRFISPKGWRLMHPEEHYPDSKKKDMVMLCIEDFKKTQDTQMKAITNGSQSASPRRKKRTTQRAATSPSMRRPNPNPPTPAELVQTTDMAQVKQDLEKEAGSNPTFLTQVPGDSPRASPAPPTTMADLHLARMETTFTEPEVLAFQHSTATHKWEKFQGVMENGKTSTWRPRPKVDKPPALLLKPKFNPSRYVQKHKDKVTENALRRREMIETGIIEPQLLHPERILNPEEHQKVKKKKPKIKWVSAIVQDLLKRVVRTENLKLTALENELHLEIRKGTAPALLKDVRESIQTIRRRIADLRAFRPSSFAASVL